MMIHVYFNYWLAFFNAVMCVVGAGCDRGHRIGWVVGAIGWFGLVMRTANYIEVMP